MRAQPLAWAMAVAVMALVVVCSLGVSGAATLRRSSRSAEALAMLELGVDVSALDPALFHDSANGASFLRAPYLPSTVNGPMYSRAGPQSGVAKAWLEKAAQPAWSALPFGPRTPSAAYVLPFDHMREVQDEFSWNYDHNAPAPPPQFAFAAPIFLEQASQQHSTAEVEAEAETEVESEMEAEAEAQAEQVEFVQALEVDDLASALFSDEDLALAEVSATDDGPKALISPDFWSSRGASPGFTSYSNPYRDLVNPSLRGTFADFRPNFRAPLQQLGQSGWFNQVRTGFVPQPHAYAYHQGSLPPFAHEIEPFKSMSNTSPNVIEVGENDEVQTFLQPEASMLETEAETQVEAEDGCIGCQFD